ncbi:YER140W [Zygosaccharomyces parabailii]|nr:YER140W [Zygosaccharomyces parabailii]CDH10859.1 related to Protein TAPT1 homolog [Zygosaccharomyces bailii ISA1307]
MDNHDSPHVLDAQQEKTSDNASGRVPCMRSKVVEKMCVIQSHLYREIVHAVEESGGIHDASDGDLEDIYEVEQLLNMVRIPSSLEKFMIWTLLACSDCFLHYFTITPLRVVRGFILKYRLRERYRSSEMYNDGCMICLIIIAAFFLNKLDTSKAYHRIKRQSSVKLYMLFSVLEMVNKMLASMGQSLFAVLFSRKNSQRALPKRLLMQMLCLVYLMLHGYVMAYQTVALNVAVNSYSNALLTLLLSMQFAEIKSCLFKRIDKEGLFQITIADVVERFQLMLLLLIISLRNMLAKSKTQPSVIPNSWKLRLTSSLVAGILYGPTVNVIGSGLVVDWVKHAYITKFNRIRPKVYDKFLFILCKDHSSSLLRFRDRLGLPIPALAVLFIVMIRPSLVQVLDFSTPSHSVLAATMLTTGFVALVVLKIALHMLLIKWGRFFLDGSRITTAVTENEYVPGLLSGGLGKVDKKSRSIIHLHDSYVGQKSTIAEGNIYNGKIVEDSRSSSLVDSPTDVPPGLNDLRRNKNSKNPHSLENVARYKMVSKQIW